MASTDVADAVHAGYLAEGLSGYTFASATTPSACNGTFVRKGTHNSTNAYSHYNQAYVLWRDTATSKWKVGPSAGSATVYFEKAGATVTGTYTAVTGTGAPTLSAQNVYIGAAPLDQSMTLLTPYGGRMHPGIQRVMADYRVRILVQDTDQEVARVKADAAYLALDSLKGQTTAALGWTLSGMTAIQVDITPPALIGLLPADAGPLYQYVANLRLVNLTIA